MTDKKTNTYKVLIVVIILIGLFLRVFFINKTNVVEYQFDAGIGDLKAEKDYEKVWLDSTGEDFIGRHLDYILQIYRTGHVPSTLIGQYYHPPLSHAIFAGWLKIMDNFSDSARLKIESMQYISVLYSVLSLIVICKILKEFEISDKNILLFMIIATFLPIGIYMSGAINNDGLVTLFTLMALLYLIRWQKDQSIKNTLLLSLSIGLGLLTKTSIVLMIIPSLIVFFKELIKRVNEDEEWKTLIVEALIFTIIICALGLPYHLYSASIGKDTIGISQPPEEKSIAMYSLFDRFGPSNLFKIKDYNLFNSYINTQIGFGLVETNFLVDKIMVGIVTVLFVQSLYMIIVYYKESILLLSTFITWWFGYFYLNIAMPYYSSQNSRYMIVPIICGLLFMILRLEKSDNKVYELEMKIVSVAMMICSVAYFIFGFAF